MARSNKIFVFCMLVGVILFGTGPSRAGALLKPKNGVTRALREKTLSIDTRITGAFAQTVVTTTYENPNRFDTESDFIYSVPEGTAISGFAYWYRGEKVVARIVEKERATAIYQHLTWRGRDPALVEMIGHRLFRVRIFPVEGGQDLKIEIGMVQTLQLGPKGLHWSYPLAEDTSQGPLEKLHLKAVFDRPFSNNLRERAGRALTFSRSRFKGEGNLQLSAPVAEAKKRIWFLGGHTDGPDGYFALAYIPQLSEQRPTLRISGVKTYGVMRPTAPTPSEALCVVLGRYRNSGPATVQIGGNSSILRFPARKPAQSPIPVMWAARRLEMLGNNPKRQAEAKSLSHRFGLPCFWTSWLAVPKDERKRLIDEKRRWDYSDAVRAYAKAVKAGDWKRAKKEEWTFRFLERTFAAEAKATGRSFSPEDLNRELTWELYGVRQAQDITPLSKVKKGQAEQWQAAAARLLAKGARESYVTVKERKTLQDAMRSRATVYVGEIVANRADGAIALEAKQNLEQLSQTRVAKWAGIHGSSYVGIETEKYLWPLAKEIVTLKIAGLDQSPQYIGSKSTFDRLAGPNPDSKSWYFGQFWQDHLGTLSMATKEEVLAKRDELPHYQFLLSEIERVKQLAGYTNGYYGWYDDSWPWRGRAHEAAYRIIETEEQASPDPAEVAALKQELAKAAKKTYTKEQAFLNWEAMRREYGEPIILARDYSLRWGDPLIAIQAPSDCLQVLAKLPSGELKPLLWNGVLKRWEARFDVPGYATQGPYAITILIVNRNGTRRQLTMNFDVDLSAPTGRAKVVGKAGTWQLSIQTDADVALADAFTPWGKRVSLTRSENLFTGEVAVPPEWADHGSKVTYVLTDKAHNRTTLIVDMNDDSALNTAP